MILRGSVIVDLTRLFRWYSYVSAGFGSWLYVYPMRSMERSIGHPTFLIVLTMICWQYVGSSKPLDSV